MEAYGLDASPALSVIAGALGAVGPKPDLVLSGINHGVNVGRSILHSGTVGAALTASQLGISALAVSLRAGETPTPGSRRPTWPWPSCPCWWRPRPAPCSTSTCRPCR